MWGPAGHKEPCSHAQQPAEILSTLKKALRMVSAINLNAAYVTGLRHRTDFLSVRMYVQKCMKLKRRASSQGACAPLP